MKPDGGPAFPANDYAVKDSLPADAVLRLAATRGMTLRDFFAAAALTGLVAADVDDVRTANQSANDAFVIADAMLAARNVQWKIE